MIRLKIEGKVYEKMKHDDFLEMAGLTDIDGSLTEENRREFEAHMASCTDCKRIFQEQKTAADKLEMLRAEAPAGLLDNALKKETAQKQGKMDSRNCFCGCRYCRICWGFSCGYGRLIRLCRR